MKKDLSAEIICVGTELLTGKLNTHTAYLAGPLSSLGMLISYEQTVGDDPRQMENVFRTALTRSDFIFCCGGLGPTFDDITRDVWSKIVKRPLQFRSELLEDIQQKFTTRGLAMPPHNKRQAFVLKGAEVIPNLKGTAPGQILKLRGKTLVILPGPTRELVSMMEEIVVPKLKSELSTLYVAQKEFHSIGYPESQLDQMVRPLVISYQKVRGLKVTHGILASQSVVTVKFSLKGNKRTETEEAAEFLARKFRKRIGDKLFGEANDTIPKVVAHLLTSKRKKLAVAESCTGGLIAKLLTDASGASDYFTEGLVTYSNTSKVRRLGVKKKTLDKEGAVSEAVAKQMAEGLKRETKVDYALSVTGIAGPTGGTAEKPVGLVYIGCSAPKGTFVKRFQFSGDREWIRHRSALIALDVLRKEILGLR